MASGVIRLLAAIGLGCAATPPASAGTIYWSMQTLAATSSTAAGVAASDLSQGNSSVTGTSTTSASTGYSFTLDDATTPASGLNNLQFRGVAGLLSPSTSTFLEVTVTTTSAATRFVTGFGFGSRSTASGPQAYSLLTSTDGFLTHDTVGTGSLQADSVWAYKTVALALPLPLLTASPVTFRLYGHGGTSAANGNWRIDDVQMTFVPEPAAPAGLAGLLALGLAAAVRRHRSAAVSPPRRT